MRSRGMRFLTMSRIVIVRQLWSSVGKHAHSYSVKALLQVADKQRNTCTSSVLYK
jgi:hypothetical protein